MKLLKSITAIFKRGTVRKHTRWSKVEWYEGKPVKDKIMIRDDPDCCTQTHIYLNGVELHNVHGFRITQVSGKIATITLDFTGMSVDIDKWCLTMDQTQFPIRITRYNVSDSELEKYAVENTVGREV